MRRLSVHIVALALVVPGVSYAQLSLISGGGLSISASPALPAPGEVVRLSAESFVADLSRSTIYWYKDASPVGEGGTIEVRTGEAGESETYTAEASNDEGIVATGSITIRPASAEIVWESDALVPPFYRGRALPGPGTRVRAEANVRFKRSDGSFIPPSDIVYSWERNGKELAGVSGRGKSRISVPAPLLFSTDKLSVFAESMDRAYAAEAHALIPSTDTVLVLYLDHPLFGVRYTQALAPETTLAETEATLAAIPYFAEAARPDDSKLLYRWAVNGRVVESDPEEPDRITLSADGSNGFAFLELALEHATNWFEASKSAWQITLSNNVDGLFSDPFRSSQ